MGSQGYPVYDISGLDALQSDILVRPFAPYALEHRKLHIPHRHSFYHLVYFTTGAGYHTIDFNRFEVRPFQLYAMVPGQVHHWDFQGDVDGYVLNFSDSFFQSFLLRADYLENLPLFQGVAQDSVVDIPVSLREKVKELFEEMVALGGSINPITRDKLRVLALKLFLDVAGVQDIVRHAIPSSYNVTLLRNFQRLVDKHFVKLRLPKAYAALLYITPNHLNAICSDVFGLSAGEVIRNRVVLEAKRLLVNPQLTVSVVAGQLNFKDNSYFTKFFKKNTGTTPEQFRKELAIGKAVKEG